MVHIQDGIPYLLLLQIIIIVDEAEAGLDRNLCGILTTMLFCKTEAIYSHNLSNSRNRGKFDQIEYRYCAFLMPK